MHFLLAGWQQAIIVIVVALVVIYLLLIYFAISSLSYFNKKLKNSRNALKIIIAELFYLIEELQDLLNELKISYNTNTLKELKHELEDDHLDGLYSKTSKLYNELFIKLNNEVFDENNKKILNDSYKKYEENNYLYMQITDTYNNDILGYNYWCRFILTRPFTSLLKYKKLERLL